MRSVGLWLGLVFALALAVPSAAEMANVPETEVAGPLVAGDAALVLGITCDARSLGDAPHNLGIMVKRGDGTVAATLGPGVVNPGTTTTLSLSGALIGLGGRFWCLVASTAPVNTTLSITGASGEPQALAQGQIAPDDDDWSQQVQNFAPPPPPSGKSCGLMGIEIAIPAWLAWRRRRALLG